MTIATLTPAEAQAQIAQGARLIDIRDADEYAREHIPDAELVPLATLTSGAPLNARAGETVIFHCQAGSRTQNNAIRLAAAAAAAQPCLLAGGIQAWKAAGIAGSGRFIAAAAADAPGANCRWRPDFTGCCWAIPLMAAFSCSAARSAPGSPSPA